MRSLLFSYWGFFPPFHAIYTHIIQYVCWLFVLFSFRALFALHERHDAVPIYVHLIEWSVLYRVQRTYSHPYSNRMNPKKKIASLCVRDQSSSFKRTTDDVTNKHRIVYAVCMFVRFGVTKLQLLNEDRCFDAKQLKQKPFIFHSYLFPSC